MGSRGWREEERVVEELRVEAVRRGVKGRGARERRRFWRRGVRRAIAGVRASGRDIVVRETMCLCCGVVRVVVVLGLGTNAMRYMYVASSVKESWGSLAPVEL